MTISFCPSIPISDGMITSFSYVILGVSCCLLIAASFLTSFSPLFLFPIRTGPPFLFLSASFSFSFSFPFLFVLYILSLELLMVVVICLMLLPFCVPFACPCSFIPRSSVFLFFLFFFSPSVVDCMMNRMMIIVSGALEFGRFRKKFEMGLSFLCFLFLFSCFVFFSLPCVSRRFWID